jgi:hypothetical protein
MTEQLTDDHLRRLKGAGGERAPSDPCVLKLMADVVNTYKWEEIHWLTDDREAVFHDWYGKRLHRGRLAGMNRHREVGRTPAQHRREGPEAVRDRRAPLRAPDTSIRPYQQALA